MVKDKSAFFLLLVAGFFLFAIFSPHISYEKLTQLVQITNSCSTKENSLQNVDHYSLLTTTLPQFDKTTYIHKFYDFTFTIPSNSWYMSENFVQRYEQEIAYPLVAYSLSFASPVPQDNATSWSNRQQAVITLRIFPNSCQSNDTWYRFLSENNTLTKKHISIDNIAAIAATTTTRHNVAYVLFNHGNWHYEFYLQVKDKNDFQHYLDIFNTTVESFSI